MATTRREFLQTSLAAGGALALPSSTDWLFRSSKPLKFLILGGTGFIGPHMIRRAQERGHTVSMFNRGKTAPELFPNVEHLTGDRDKGLDSLKGKKWDVVIDNSGYVPRHVRDSAELLKDSVSRYLFISTGSVYAPGQEKIDEDSQLLVLEDPTSEDVNKHYGALKVHCEKAINEIYGDRGTIVRLHIVAGPGDTTDRFTYWPVRFAKGGEMIAPGAQDGPVQYVDVRDVADFCVHLLENNTGGIYNAAGPTGDQLGMADFLATVKKATGSNATLTWVDEAFVREQKAGFPLWIPQGSPMKGLARVSSKRGMAKGLKFRPVSSTVKDTLAWFQAEPAERQAKLNLNLERDAKILEAWKKR